MGVIPHHIERALTIEESLNNKVASCDVDDDHDDHDDIISVHSDTSADMRPPKRIVKTKPETPMPLVARRSTSQATSQPKLASKTRGLDILTRIESVLDPSTLHD
jgi:hypothetical protein